MEERIIKIKGGNVTVDGTFVGDEVLALFEFIEKIREINSENTGNNDSEICEKNESIISFPIPIAKLESILGDEFVEKKPSFHVENKYVGSSIFVKSSRKNTTFLDLKRMIDTAYSLFPSNSHISICFPDFRENMTFEGRDLDSYLDDFVNNNGNPDYYCNKYDNAGLFYYILPEMFFNTFIQKIYKYKKSFRSDPKSIKLIKDAFVNFIKKDFKG